MLFSLKAFAFSFINPPPPSPPTFPSSSLLSLFLFLPPPPPTNTLFFITLNISCSSLTPSPSYQLKCTFLIHYSPFFTFTLTFLLPTSISYHSHFSILHSHPSLFQFGPTFFFMLLTILLNLLWETILFQISSINVRSKCLFLPAEIYLFF